MQSFAWMHWDPSPELFYIPWIDHPVRWYGLCFVSGFFLAYLLIQRILLSIVNRNGEVTPGQVRDWRALCDALHDASDDPGHPLGGVWGGIAARTRKALRRGGSTVPDSAQQQEVLAALNGVIAARSGGERRTLVEGLVNGSVITVKQFCTALADRLTWFTIAGTLIGARLGYVFFYAWGQYRDHPLDILKVWHGGLASHGGAVGVMLALWLFLRSTRRDVPSMSYFALLDYVAVPTALVAFFIRLGNFFNQEIVGYPTLMPWAIVFGHPADGGAAVPRHPVQLYEGLWYLTTFAILWSLWRRWGNRLRQGVVTGTFLVMVFGARFFLEFLKVPQGFYDNEQTLIKTGQLLSLPFVVIGLTLLLLPRLRRRARGPFLQALYKP